MVGKPTPPGTVMLHGKHRPRHRNLSPDRRSRPKAAEAAGKSRPVKAQTTMVLILLVMLLFAGTVIFLLTFAKNISQSDWMNLYVHNMLLSLMRSDTGYTDPNCKLVSDALSCAFFSPGYICDQNGPTCLGLANRTATEYVERFSLIKKSYRYLLTVEPQGFNVLDNNGEPFKIIIGDAGIAVERQTKFTANEQMRKPTATGVYNLNARLMIMMK